MTTTTAAPTAYDRQKTILENEVAELNNLLGEHKATVGYIGNGKLGIGGWDLSDVRWYVFLPHPGRIGTSEDRVGGWADGSVEGVVATRRALASLIQGVRLARSI